MTKQEIVAAVKKADPWSGAYDTQIEAGADYVIAHGVPNTLVQSKNGISVHKVRIEGTDKSELVTRGGPNGEVRTPITPEIENAIAVQYILMRTRDRQYFRAG